jgi:cobalt/nickel transport system permease protein
MVCGFLYLKVHIPDGFLDTKTIIATSVFSLAGLTAALRRVKALAISRNVAMIGLSAAFVFAAQMINFPVAGGTSGHLIGAVLIAVLLGPSAAILVISAVLVVQCFLFADGGVLALGANIFNMAIAGSFGGWLAYRLVRVIIPGDRGMTAGIIFASWFSTVLASVICAGELAWSGTVSWQAAFTGMANVHMLIGIGEALITVLVIRAIARIRPGLVGDADEHRASFGRMEILYGTLLVLGIILFILPFASGWPDGLERVAANLGFEHKAVSSPLVASPFGDYHFPGIGSPAGATAVAGLIGAVVVFVLGIGLAGIFRIRHAAPAQTEREG